MTYSLLAYDEDSLGVATASHWVAVGSVVPWARAGVGVVATQAFTAPSYGPALLDGLAAAAPGDTRPGTVLSGLLAADRLAAFRQVAVIDASGTTASHTGAGCFPATAHAELPGALAIGNMLAGTDVGTAMVDAWSEASGTLAHRLLAGLMAGQDAGGDARGRQAAALLVVDRHARGAVGDGIVIDLRVDDDADPVGVLARLLPLAERAAHVSGAAFPTVMFGRSPDSAGLLRQADELAGLATAVPPGGSGRDEVSREAALWQAYYLLLRGDDTAARSAVRDHPELFDVAVNWAARRLPETGH